MTFIQQVKERRWFVTGGECQTTHLLMDGSGKLCVPDSHAGTFLNMYFTCAVVRGERLSVVERRTPIFRLFFDLDIRISEDTDPVPVIRRISTLIWDYVTRDFFILESSGTNTVTGSSTVGPDSDDRDTGGACTSIEKDRMIVCTAPIKLESPGVIKAGCHLVFPSIYVNSPIALKCRDNILDRIERSYIDGMSHSTSAQSVTQCAYDSDEATTEETRMHLPLNSWRDLIDDSVYKGSGLRLVWSHKGRGESRQYTPVYDVTSVDGFVEVSCHQSMAEKREYVHDSSIRTTTCVLTPCRGGEHQVADRVNGHTMFGTVVSGRSQSIDMYRDALSAVEQALPREYRGIQFLKAFVTPQTIYLKTNSRYCLNVKREHRTSTIYISVTRQGVMVRCYSRKEEYDCARFASDPIQIPHAALRVFFPDIEEPQVQKAKPFLQSTKRRRVSSHSILHGNPLFRACK